MEHPAHQPAPAAKRGSIYPAPIALAALLLAATFSASAAHAADPPVDPPSAIEVDSAAPRAPDNATVADLRSLETAFQQVAEQVAPSVVAIRARRRVISVTEIVPVGASPDPSGGSAPARPESTTPGRLVEHGLIVHGSGSIISPDGLILTNEHVIRAAAEIEVTLHDGHRFDGHVAAADARSDFALVRIAARDLPPVQFCDWAETARGQWSLAVGNPYGLAGDGQLSLSVGIIANLDRHLPGLGESDDRLYVDMLQTTAPVHPGNSGGPLFNLAGELIGIVTAVHARGVDDEGVGFAIPLSTARRRIIEQLRSRGTVEYGYLGAAVVDFPPAASSSNSPPLAGVIVEQLEPGGPAAQAGLQIGDILIECDGQPVRDAMSLAEIVGLTPAGTTLPLRVQRGEETLPLRAVLERRDPKRVARLAAPADA